MSRNDEAPKPYQPPCETGQFANGAAEADYFDLSWNPNGWVPQGGPESASPGGDPGRFHNARIASDFEPEKESTGYGYQLPESEDPGQEKGQRAETTFVDVSRSDRGKES